VENQHISVDKSLCYYTVMESLQFYRLIKVKDNPLTYLSVPYYKVKFDMPLENAET